MTHMMFTHKGKFYSFFKNWNYERAEKVLERLGATYYEIGI